MRISKDGRIRLPEKFEKYFGMHCRITEEDGKIVIIPVTPEVVL